MADRAVPVYGEAGEKVGTQKLNAAVFGVPFKDPVVHQAVTAQMANRRQVLAHTKGRGDVRGGGKKPWKQKGTGRARHGSTRSPLWVGGGITFGPTKERNFGIKINKQVRKQALRMVLSDKAASDRLVVISDWIATEGKAKKLAAFLKALPVSGKKMMLVTEPADASVIRAAKNLAKAITINVGSLNVVDVMKYEYLVVPKKLIATIDKRYGA
ncbi:MAG: 50S ribosomal protein L4 [Candidatus Komeilibacteria bacterium]|nr:50S ribosomal protein L4 [Candidatus Komeilibacteria bacterium]